MRNKTSSLPFLKLKPIDLFLLYFVTKIHYVYTDFQNHTACLISNFYIKQKS